MGNELITRPREAVDGDVTSSPHWRATPEADAGYAGLFATFEGVEYGHIWWKARVKSDGCIDLYHYVNTPIDLREPGEVEDCDDYIHICDIDAMIARLQSLKQLAVKHFTEQRGQWPE